MKGSVGTPGRMITPRFKFVPSNRHLPKLDERIAEVRKLLWSGHGAAEIGRRLGVSDSTVRGFIKRRGIAKPMKRPKSWDRGIVNEHQVPGMLPQEIGQLTERANPNGRVLMSDIKRAVCEHFLLTEQQLQGRMRSRAVAYPRMVAMVLARELTALSFPAIAHRLGDRDHTTILSGCRRIKQVMSEDSEWAEHYAALKNHLTYRPANDEQA